MLPGQNRGERTDRPRRAERRRSVRRTSVRAPWPRTLGSGPGFPRPSACGLLAAPVRPALKNPPSQRDGPDSSLSVFAEAACAEQSYVASARRDNQGEAVPRTTGGGLGEPVPPASILWIGEGAGA